MWLVAADRFRSSSFSVFVAHRACVNIPGSTIRYLGTTLCRIEIVDMAVTSHFLGGQAVRFQANAATAGWMLL